MTDSTLSAITSTALSSYVVNSIVNTAPDDLPTDWRDTPRWTYRWIIRAAKAITSYRSGAAQPIPQALSHYGPNASQKENNP